MNPENNYSYNNASMRFRKMNDLYILASSLLWCMFLVYLLMKLLIQNISSATAYGNTVFVLIFLTVGLILYFRNCNYALVEEDVDGGNDRLGNNQSETDNASAVLRYFRYCGWLSERELGRNGDNIATVDPYCRKLIDAIERIFNRDNSAALSNQIFMIYDILHSAFNEDHANPSSVFQYS